MPDSNSGSVKVFIDLWNVVINARSQTSYAIEVDWLKLATFLVNSTNSNDRHATDRDLAGCFIFGSYNKTNPADRDFVNKTLDVFGSLPGLFFDFRERVKKDTSSKCGNCGEAVSRSSEVGVDVLLTVEMIKHSAMREHEYLVIASSDRDYLPLLSYMKDKGERLVHAATGEKHREMRSVTWKQVDLASQLPRLSKLENKELIVLTAPAYKERTDLLVELVIEKGATVKIIDLSSKDDISDRDFVWVAQNQNLTFTQWMPGGTGRGWLPNHKSGNIHEMRKLLATKELSCDLPHVIYFGKKHAAYRRMGGWDVPFSSTYIDQTSIKAIR